MTSEQATPEKMTSEQATFGRRLRDAEFLLDPESVHLNQGAWGSCPRRVVQAQARLREKIEVQPDDFFRRRAQDAWFSSLGAVCRFLDVRPENTTFIVNATTGINTVLRCIALQPGDRILLQTWTYKAIAYAAQRIAKTTGAEVVTLDIKYPIKSKEEVIDNYRNMLENDSRIKVVIIDYISSPTGVLFPVAPLVALCRQHGALSLVDGAHTPGQVVLGVEDAAPDFYTGNLHKWAFCLRPSAVLWVNPKHHDIIIPLVTSHNYKQSPWQLEFQQQGTRDDTAFLTCPEGIAFYESLGGREAITQYASTMLEAAVRLLVERWGTRRFPVPPDMEAPFLRLVRVPDNGFCPPGRAQVAFRDADELMQVLYERFNMHVVALVIQDEPWIRISAAAYNSLHEYEALADAVLTLVRENPAPPDVTPTSR